MMALFGGLPAINFDIYSIWRQPLDFTVDFLPQKAFSEPEYAICYRILLAKKLG